MTDRMAALERVAAAAREWRVCLNSDEPAWPASLTLWTALDALYALPAEPVGETVEVAIYVDQDGDVGLAVAGSPRDRRSQHSYEHRRVGVATIPTVAAKESEG